MDLNKSTTDLITLIGFGLQSAQTVMQAYSFFHLENIDNFATRLSPYKDQLLLVKDDPNFKRDFMTVLDKVAHEVELEKLEQWKNTIIHLATDFRSFSFKNTFIKILQDLTVFDLTVLSKIYSTDFRNDNFENELVCSFERQSISKQYVLLALKNLGTSNLISEVSNRASGDVPVATDIKLTPFCYTKNELGVEFLNFITDERLNNPY